MKATGEFDGSNITLWLVRELVCATAIVTRISEFPTLSDEKGMTVVHVASPVTRLKQVRFQFSFLQSGITMMTFPFGKR